MHLSRKCWNFTWINKEIEEYLDEIGLIEQFNILRNNYKVIERLDRVPQIYTKICIDLQERLLKMQKEELKIFLNYLLSEFDYLFFKRLLN
jgi:hypothetical protein